MYMAIKSLYFQPEVCVRVNGKQSNSFHVGVGLRQECILSPLFFLIYMYWMNKLSQSDVCVTTGRSKISRLLFADDLVLLASSESGLQFALNGFAAACNIAGMKISTSKNEVLHLSKNPVQCSLQVGGVLLKQVEKFKYLGVAFTSDERQDEELDVRSSKASAVKRVCSIQSLKTGAIEKGKTLGVMSIFVPIFTCGNFWVRPERVRSQMLESEMRFLHCDS